jgi:LmbE family N-acetylglucosaminyl deacetylase
LVAVTDVSADGRVPTEPPALWSPDDGVERVLVVVAHPDDVDFGSAGSVAAFTEAGLSVTYCIVTDGDAGGSDRTMSRAEMAAIRRREQLEAAAEVGVTEVEFLGYPDGRLTPSIDLRRDLSRVIRTVRPQRVLSQSPERNWDRIYASHPDHLAAAEAVACAVYPDARNPFAHPELLDDEGLEPHVVDELWLMAFGAPTIAVETTGTFDRKVAALRRHRSQVGDGEHLPGMLRGWSTRVAQAAGLPEGSLAEGYRVVLTR